MNLSRTKSWLRESVAHVTVGQRIADLRRQEGRRRGGKLTQRQLADEVGVHKGTVAAWEGDTQKPEGENLIKLARSLSASPDEILGTGDPVAEQGRGATHNGSAPADYPDGGIATADQIIETFGRPEALRRQAGHIPAKDAARAGYALAQRLQLPPAGMKRILEWHDEIMGAEGEGG